MATHARWLRLMILLSLSVMERTRGKPKLPVLFILDEFPALGHMQALETAAGLMAGFGVKLWDDHPECRPAETALRQELGNLHRQLRRDHRVWRKQLGVA